MHSHSSLFEFVSITIMFPHSGFWVLIMGPCLHLELARRNVGPDGCNPYQRPLVEAAVHQMTLMMNSWAVSLDIKYRLLL